MKNALANREMITAKQQYSVFNLLPPSNGHYCGTDGFDGLDRMRAFNLRRNSNDGTNMSANVGDQSNQRGSLTPAIDFGDGSNNRISLNMIPSL